MKKLEADIKNGIYKRVYLLFGPQSYNRKRYEKALTGLFVADSDTMNLSVFYGKDIDLKEIADLSATMPFLAEKRVIILESTGLFARSCDELCGIIENIPETCVMIFSEDKIDNRLKQTKAVRSSGCVAEFTALTEKEQRDWILKRLAKEHRQITGNALELFMRRCSDDLWQTQNELEKVISYTFGKDGIRPEDVDAVMPPLAEDKIFDMISAVLSQKEEEALALYSDLVRLQSDPMGILTLLRDQLRIISNASKMNAEHVSSSDMAALLSVKEGRIRMALPEGRKSSKIKLSKSIRMCADTEERIKSGMIDPRIGLETLIVGLCRIKDDRRDKNV
ncbi:MAG: DNA polymerase III subunit delta [Lachnospiraceae bacterium]|nr:DNA polymerase III subunit delta [Lachnospiraceae bacterium]